MLRKTKPQCGESGCAHNWEVSGGGLRYLSICIGCRTIFPASAGLRCARARFACVDLQRPYNASGGQIYT